MKEFLPDRMDFDEAILRKPKRAIESIENEFYRREKKKPKKHVHRRNRQIKNKIYFVNICTHEKVLRLLII